jgi:hypothetical protein
VLQLPNGQLDINKMDFVNPAVHSTAERPAEFTKQLDKNTKDFVTWLEVNRKELRAAVLCTAGFKNRPLLFSSIACNAAGLRTDVSKKTLVFIKNLKNKIRLKGQRLNKIKYKTADHLLLQLLSKSQLGRNIEHLLFKNLYFYIKLYYKLLYILLYFDSLNYKN